MDSLKISSLSPSCTPPQETNKNRFEPLTFSKHFHHLNAWNAIDQRMPSCVGTALKVVLAVPVYLVEMVARAAEAIGNTGVWALNGHFGRSVEAVDTSKLDLPPAKKVYDEPILKKADKLVSPSLVIEKSANTETPEEAVPTSKETDAPVAYEPAPVAETPLSTTTTLIEKQPSEENIGWEWDANNPDQIRVRYPEPAVPTSKGSYLTTALGVIGLAAVSIPALYYGYNYITSTEEAPTYAWRLIQVMSNQGASEGCMKTLCDGSFECVNNCPESMIPNQ